MLTERSFKIFCFDVLLKSLGDTMKPVVGGF